MPEIAEVARVVHFLRKHLVNYTIDSCKAFDDPIVYGKVGCSAQAFQDAVQGKKVISVGQQGKYFYLIMDKPPHPVLHLGMSGWVKLDREDTGYYKKAQVSEPEKEEWPPKYAKFLLGGYHPPASKAPAKRIKVAFVDARRLGRIRLVDCEAANIRDASPLKENGPDPVVDKDIFTFEWLANLTSRKVVPIKALLLNQSHISGIGNWVADEVLYQAQIYPAQYCNTLSQDEVRRLHAAIVHVCTTACDLLADSSKFPSNWLMKYRWDKGKTDANVLPNGETIEHMTVGGRTTAYVPSVQIEPVVTKAKEVSKPLKRAQEESQPKEVGNADGSTSPKRQKMSRNETRDLSGLRRSTRTRV